MKNIRNLALARLHNQLSAIQAKFHKMQHVDNDNDFQDLLKSLDVIVSQLQQLAYGDCQFVHRLPYPVKPSVNRGRLHIFPKPSKTETLQDVA